MLMTGVFVLIRESAWYAIHWAYPANLTLVPILLHQVVPEVDNNLP